MLAPIFSGEYEGVDNIILTSKYGKTKCTTAKVAAGILTAILTTALVAAFNLLLALIFYGTEGLDCSILFAPQRLCRRVHSFQYHLWNITQISNPVGIYLYPQRYWNYTVPICNQ